MTVMHLRRFLPLPRHYDKKGMGDIMRKFAFAVSCLVLVTACSKHDPILPGDRSAIFDTARANVLNTQIENLPDNISVSDVVACPYRQDSSNIIWDGERKIFSGFSTPNSVQSNQRPVCDEKYVYAGLTTGELVKINPKTRVIAWIADVYRPSNLTGGASIVDIVAPIVVRDGAVYAGGLGDAFCKINATSGNKKWCVNIGVGVPFIVTDNASFVVSTDGNLYAIRNSDGAAYWRVAVKKQVAPTYSNGIITVGREQFDAHNGKIID